MDPHRLHGVWYHSHEEDSGDRVVFRGRGYDFPRSRAPRDSLTIEPDGALLVGGPGPADASSTTRGTWSLDEDVLTLTAPGRHDEYEIESLSDEKLVLRPLPPGR